MSVLYLYGIILLLANTLVCPIPTDLGISQFLWYNHSMPIHNTLAFGADPVTMQWSVVRGDTGTLRVEFYESNEVDFYDTTGWIFRATAYDQSGNVLDALDCEPGEGFVDITAYPSVILHTLSLIAIKFTQTQNGGRKKCFRSCKTKARPKPRHLNQDCLNNIPRSSNHNKLNLTYMNCDSLTH